MLVSRGYKSTRTRAGTFAPPRARGSCTAPVGGGVRCLWPCLLPAAVICGEFRAWPYRKLRWHNWGVGETACAGFPRPAAQSCQKPLKEDGWAWLLCQCNWAPGTAWGVQSLLLHRLLSLFCLTGEVHAICFICLHFTVCICSHFSTGKSLLWYLLFYTSKIAYFFSNWLLLMEVPSCLKNTC